MTISCVERLAITNSGCNALVFHYVMGSKQRHDLIKVEVVYALPRKQTVIALNLPEGATVGEALARSGIAASHPELDLGAAAIGIFGKRVAVATVLADHDRVEIYRPLIADPKQVRRMRARKPGR